ncbi:winged helix-turn-helix transcriptional regulator [Erythrobacter sp. SCSIO 43205]|uniref:MarR family winged helix-turn-helix transcriptional regulator n=1 Tax=Erythrobacter sp. SCSIO 43205 TaxID=2779361 RepID=UPI001CA8E06B|nr:MarR family winged helix-turn-helix transcriptional regulator [Erythrobacter sp. SCSIO 43205]UAB79114.1 winged helix-turn-helix transcriptional regulator [Erythrobacter sp. SCSIO 43205]
MTQDTSFKSGDNQLASFLPYQLSITSNAVSGLIAQRYRSRFGLKVTEWRVIAVLGDAHTQDGGMTQRDLTEATLMDKVAVNRACKVLEERGLIARVENEADGRSHLLALTDEGQGIHREVMPLAKATERDLLDGLDDAEEAALRSMLAKLRARAGALASFPKE